MINACTQSATAPIRPFLGQSSVGAFPGTATAPAVQFTQEQALAANATFKEVCEREVRAWSIRVKIYLEDERTAGVLSTAVQNEICPVPWVARRLIRWGGLTKRLQRRRTLELVAFMVQPSLRNAKCFEFSLGSRDFVPIRYKYHTS